ncbi:MAG: DUF4034 domain-containing protein [Proteobacteria bacterium]|nr:DUF4034 domain-containing protein [Pseudomonadota bacterium]
MRSGVRRSAGRALCAIGCAVLLGGACAGEAVQKEDMADQVASAAWWGDYDELQRLYDAAKASQERMPNGDYVAEQFIVGYARIFNNGEKPNTDAYYAQVEKLTRQWALDHPASSMAQNMYARALYAHAWFVRGGSYAVDVEPQAWAGFKRYIGMAADHLLQHADVVKGDTTTTIYLVMIERAAGATFDFQWAIARDGLRREPDNWGIYTEMAVSALDKWGGTADQLDTVARYAASISTADRAHEIYTRVYLLAAQEYKGATFTKTKANWSELQQGFEAMLARDPGPDVLNSYARMACMAQDKARTRSLLARIGDRLLPQKWGGGDGQRVLDVCAQWARSE